MGTVIRQFRDVEKALVVGLPTVFPELEIDDDGRAHVDDRTPPDLEAMLPFVSVEFWPGDDDWLTDRPRVDFNVFTADRDSGYALAEGIRTWLLGFPFWIGNEDLQVLIDRVDTLVRPFKAEWAEGSTINRRLATYQLSVRR